MLQGVIFDLDNTLYDYDACDKKAYAELAAWMAEYLDINIAQFSDIYAQAKEIVKEQLGDVGASHNRMLYMQNVVEMLGFPSTLYALDMYNVYWDTMLKEMQLFPYVLPLMESLRERKIKIGILTDLTAHIQHRKIRALGLEEYIDVLVSSEEAGREKPDSCMFELIVKKMSIPKEQLLMIGDSLEKDVRGAQRRGIDAVWYDKKLDTRGDILGQEVRKRYISG